jgi:TIR domain
MRTQETDKLDWSESFIDSSNFIESSLDEWLQRQSKTMNIKHPLVYRAPSVFLSYARQDSRSRESAYMLHLLLDRNGLNPWFHEDINEGVEWRKTIAARLRDVDCGVLLHSKILTNSEWVGVERAVLADANKLVVVRVDEAPLPDTISHLQANIAFHDWSGDASAARARKLLDSIEKFANAADYDASVGGFLGKELKGHDHGRGDRDRGDHDAAQHPVDANATRTP